MKIKLSIAITPILFLAFSTQVSAANFVTYVSEWCEAEGTALNQASAMRNAKNMVKRDIKNKMHADCSNKYGNCYPKKLLHEKYHPQKCTQSSQWFTCSVSAQINMSYGSSTTKLKGHSHMVSCN